MTDRVLTGNPQESVGEASPGARTAGASIAAVSGSSTSLARTGATTDSAAGLTALAVVKSQRDWNRRLLIVACVGVAIWFLWQVQEVLPPFLISIGLAALLDPTVRSMERHGRSRLRAIVTLYVFGLCLVGVFLMFVVPLATEQVTALSHNTNVYYANVQKTADKFLHRNSRILSLVGIKQQHVSDLLNSHSSPVKARIDEMLSGLSGIVSNAAGKIIWIVIIPITTFFIMRDYPVLRARLLGLFPEDQQHTIDVIGREIVDVFIAYLRGLTKICFLYGIAAFLLFELLGVDYALFLGLMAGAFYAIPYIGPFLTMFVGGVVAYSMDAHHALFWQFPSHSIAYTIMLLVCVLVVNQVFDQIVFPRVVGESVGLHPVLSIFALMAGATLFSVWGMLLAVPVAASIQIIIMYFFPRMSRPVPSELVEDAVPTPDVHGANTA